MINSLEAALLTIEKLEKELQLTNDLVRQLSYEKTEARHVARSAVKNAIDPVVNMMVRFWDQEDSQVDIVESIEKE